MLKVVTTQEPKVIPFSFDFEIDEDTFRLTVSAVTEQEALALLYNVVDRIREDIEVALDKGPAVEIGKIVFEDAPRTKAPRKPVIATDFKKKTVVPPASTETEERVNGVKINHPKRVNNPGFQPSFRESVD